MCKCSPWRKSVPLQANYILKEKCCYKGQYMNQSIREYVCPKMYLSKKVTHWNLDLYDKFRFQCWFEQTRRLYNVNYKKLLSVIWLRRLWIHLLRIYVLIGQNGIINYRILKDPNSIQDQRSFSRDEYWPVSQSCPVKPSSQEHVYVSNKSLQLPPLKQTTPVHSLIS